MNKWGKGSVRNINTVYKVLQILARYIIVRSPYDLTVLKSGGKRTDTEQNVIYLRGDSKCDGYIKISYHQSGFAIDFVPFIDGKATWSNGLAFLTVAKIIFEIWDEMIESGESEGYYLHWGGFWGAKDLDKDGLLEISDKLGWDGAHYELRTIPQKNVIKISV